VPITVTEKFESRRSTKPRFSCSRLISFCCFFQSTPKGGLAMR